MRTRRYGMPQRRGVQRASGAIAGVLGALLIGSAGHAMMPDTGFFQYGVEVPDSELADLRGRFVSNGQITEFGLGIYTLLQTPDNYLLTVGLELGANLVTDEVSPVVSFFYSTPGGESPSVDVAAALETAGVTDVEIVNPAVRDFGKPGGVEPAAASLNVTSQGLENFKGTSQSIRVAGSDFNVSNNMRISIGNDPADPAFAALGPTGIPQELTGTTSRQFDGITASAVLDGNQMGIVVDMPEMGAIKQMIGAGQIGQHVNITGGPGGVIRHEMFINFTRESVSRPAVQSLIGMFPDLR